MGCVETKAGLKERLCGNVLLAELGKLIETNGTDQPVKHEQRQSGEIMGARRASIIPRSVLVKSISQERVGVGLHLLCTGERP